MLKVHRQGAIVAIAGTLWLIMSLEKAAMIPFTVNDRFGDIYASKPPAEVAIYMAISQIGAASTYSFLFIMYLLGNTNNLVGCLISAWLTTRLGPLVLIRLVSGLWGGSCVWGYFTEHTLQVLFSKAGKGLAMGAVSFCVPFYLFEVLVPPDRGMGMGSISFGSVTGQSIIIALGFILLQFFVPAQALHYTWLGEACLGGVTFLLSFLLPELPATSCRRGKYEIAYATATKLLGKRDGSLLITEGCFPFSLKEIWFEKVTLRIVISTVTLLLAQVASFGITGQFLNYVLALCGVTDVQFLVATIVQYSIILVFSIPPIFFLKRASRKDFLAAGYFFLVFCYGTIAILTIANGSSAQPTLILGPSFAVRGWSAAVVLACMGAVGMMLTTFISSTSILYAMEILPYRARTKGFSVAMFVSWSVSAVMEAFSHKLPLMIPFFLFLGLLIFSLLASIFFICSKETRDKSFGEGIPLGVESQPSKIKSDDVLSKAYEAVKQESLSTKSAMSERLPRISSVARETSLNRLSLAKPPKRQVSIEVPDSGATSPLYTANTHLQDPRIKHQSFAQSSRRVDSKPSSMWLDSTNLVL